MINFIISGMLGHLASAHKEKKPRQNPIQSVHDGKKPISCKKCHQFFKSEQRLAAHITLIHEEKKPFGVNDSFETNLKTFENNWDKDESMSSCESENDGFLEDVADLLIEKSLASPVSKKFSRGTPGRKKFQAPLLALRLFSLHTGNLQRTVKQLEDGRTVS